MYDCLNINFQFGPKYLILSAQTIQNKKGPRTGYKSMNVICVYCQHISPAEGFGLAQVKVFFVTQINWKCQKSGSSPPFLKCYSVSNEVLRTYFLSHQSPFIQDRENLLAHNCFNPLPLLVEGLLSTGSTPSSFYLLVEMGLPLHLFPAYML